MKALVQRVSHAAVSSNGSPVGKIEQGLVVLLGVAKWDDERDVDYLVRKTVNLRVFEDEQGLLNKSVLDVKGSCLIVSQFTLYADTRRGNRPSFTDAATAEKSQQLYYKYVDAVRSAGVPVQTGVFQTHMMVDLCNDGPVTVMIESPYHCD